ncbi:hypothetical protein vseg_014772 [Gypsophila vaccaria]
MGSGEKHHMMINFHLNYLSNLLHHHNNNHDHDRHHDHHHHHKGVVPKGCMAILVGREGEEELQRFIIPIVYVKHPLFMKLLKEAEDEYGFKHSGPITIPCHVAEFQHVQGLIDQEHHQHHHHHHHHNNDSTHHTNNNNNHFLCFKA